MLVKGISKCYLKYLYLFGLVYVLVALFTYGYISSDMLLMNDLYEVKPEVLKVKAQFCNQSTHNTLPDVAVLDKMDIETLYLTFSRYILTKQIQCCNVRRAGHANTFGKNICLDNFKNMKTGCLVYSFGSEFNFDFENTIWTSYKCEIHTFDPSHSTKGVHIPPGVKFHLTGLSNTDETVSAPDGFIGEREWRMQTLSSIRNSLKHTKRFIDILKLDIEGWEWKALPDILQSGVLKYVKQLCLEVHFGYIFPEMLNGNQNVATTWGNVSIQSQLQILKRLHEHGFRIFMSDPLETCGTYHLKKAKQSIRPLVEISLVNIYNH